MGCFKDEEDATTQHVLPSTAKDAIHLKSYSSLNTDEEQSVDSGTDTKSNKRSILLGYFLAIFATFVMTIGMASVQALNRSIPHSELNGLRFSVTLVICAVYLVFKRHVPSVPKDTIIWVILAAVGYIGMSYAGYGQTYYLPLGTGSATDMSIEIPLSLVLAWIITKTWKLVEILASFAVLAGVIMVTQPPFIFPNAASSLLDTNRSYLILPCGMNDFSELYVPASTNNSTNDQRIDSHKRDLIIGYTFAVLESVFVLLCFNVTRYKLSTMNVFVLNFWISLLGVSMSFFLMSFTETPTFPSNLLCGLFLSVHMATAGTQVFMYIRASQLISPLCMTLVATLTIPLSFVFQYTVLSGLYPGWGNVYEIVGAVVVFAGNIMVPVNQLME